MIEDRHTPYDTLVETSQRPVCPKTWLVESILVLVLCCLPFGIVAVVYSSKVESLYYSGDYAGAEQASRDAKKFTLLGAGLGVLVYVLPALFYLFFILFALYQGEGVGGYEYSL